MAASVVKKYLIGLAVTALLAWFVVDALTQPGPQNLPGHFEEVALYRNENNTGPIVRVYAVTLDDTLWHAMVQYGQFMPHTKYGRTTVYFFPKGRPVPTRLRPGAQPFAPEFRSQCLARFEKDAMGNVAFQRYPFAR